MTEEQRETELREMKKTLLHLKEARILLEEMWNTYSVKHLPELTLGKMQMEIVQFHIRMFEAKAWLNQAILTDSNKEQELIVCMGASKLFDSLGR